MHRHDLTDCAEAGRGNGDQILAKNQRSAIDTLVERQIHLVRILPLLARGIDHLDDAFSAGMGDLPGRLLRSIMWDLGTEKHRHLKIAATLRTRVYPCESRSPRQCGSNENSNGPLRQHVPKRCELAAHTLDHPRAVEPELDCRLRIVLDDHSTADLFTELQVAAEGQMLQRSLESAITDLRKLDTADTSPYGVRAGLFVR